MTAPPIRPTDRAREELAVAIAMHTGHHTCGGSDGGLRSFGYQMNLEPECPTLRALRAVEEEATPTCVSYLGSAAEYLLDEACLGVMQAFGERPYLVGSATEKGGWRDVDVRVMLPDARFTALFGTEAPRTSGLWKLLCVAISGHLSHATGLPVDFQLQSVTHANLLYGGRPRHPLCLHLAPEDPR